MCDQMQDTLEIRSVLQRISAVSVNVESDGRKIVVWGSYSLVIQGAYADDRLDG